MNAANIKSSHASKIYATCRSPRAEVIQNNEGFRSRVKVTRTSWLESCIYSDPADALAVCRRYIREASQGRVDAARALKLANSQDQVR